MEDKYREIRIGVFGGNAQNKIDWLKHLYKFFMLNEYNDRELTEKRIFKSDFSLRIPYYNNTIILLPFKEHAIDIDIKKRSEESIEEDLHFHYDKYIMNIHYGVIIEDEKNAVYKTYMNKLFSIFHIYVQKEMQSYEASELLEKNISDKWKQINDMNKHYIDFTSYTKEKHYNSFLKYAGKFVEYEKMKQNELEGMFNYSEQFSFDEHDYNDESIILLQVFATKKFDFEKKKFSPFKIQCDCFDGKECTTNQRIIPYNIKHKMFLCESCIEIKRGRKRCSACKNFTIESETIRSPCCWKDKLYCLKCLLKRVKKHNNKCICGGTLDEGVIQSIKSYEMNVNN